MMTYDLAHPSFPVIVLLLPLSAFVVQLFFGKRLPRGGDWISTTAILGGFVLSLLTAVDVLSYGDPNFHYEVSVPWIAFGHVTLTMGMLVDNLTAIMLVLVTGIASCVHFFSMYYMDGDAGYHRYFGYLSFFCFSMLGIVISDNLLMTFMFWELVGFASYSLIGFWFHRDSAAEAQKKAFVVNRVGDVGFIVGLMIVFSRVGDFRFSRVFDAVGAGSFNGAVLFGIPLLTVAGIGIFLGAMGKSAQFPLHVWLPDAMEGPTTASSLIHAATMVAAGVFLTARIFPVLTPEALVFVTWIGAITAMMAATIALVQRDIKKVLAYSTISQLGYMMLGLGAGGYAAGLSHLFTHAFFKCLLFLCAGSVIHSLHTQDMFEMGGLRKKMPVTFITMLSGALAISGVPFFSGFVSKDAILTQVYLKTLEQPDLLHRIPFLLGMGAAVLTAFYMFRLIFLTFFGTPRDRGRFDHAHESPPLATVPLVILALFTFGFFWSGSVDLPVPGHAVRIPVGFVEEGWISHLLVPPALKGLSVSTAEGDYSEAKEVEEGYADPHSAAHRRVGLLSMAAAAAGILLAWMIYLKEWISAGAVRRRMIVAALFLENLWYFDYLYDRGIVRGLHRWNRAVFRFDRKVIDGLVNAVGCGGAWTGRLAGAFDRNVIDGLVTLTADSAQRLGREFSRFQTGRIQGYVFLGLLALCLYVIVGVM
ncbi:MAG: NADH-quinone oxidoreductase subunit L [Deltaproteobacteria bacterium]|nr:NADH-quinone oxidoreductase subunit L [Deltaproteobacteria bacterium]